MLLASILGSQVQELVVALRVGVVVHNVQVCLRVVVIHLVVPAHGIGTSHEAAVDDRKLPVFSVVNLSCTRQYEGKPHGTLGVGLQVAQLRFLRNAFGCQGLAQLALSRVIESSRLGFQVHRHEWESF